ncbi:MarR family transcriptional regulator [Paracoccus hibiscisoli]|uniref:MarR family transcriptional regulator n=1 Tax=Paracoccus hibiscisoli TaxID=2023261 RepID=A0A4U0QR70_9RHOB|nr:MarR family transcriptional regulator [Paracoccus hibiscisoli]
MPGRALIPLCMVLRWRTNSGRRNAPGRRTVLFRTDCCRSCATCGAAVTGARARGLADMSRATLARHGRITQTQLAALLAIEPPTPKRQVDALVAGGFLERRS